MNNITIMGRITKEVELKESKAGKSYTKIGVAVNRRFEKDKADFFNVTLFGQQAEAVAKYTGKGKRILVTGAMQMDKTDNGIYWNLIANEVEIIDFLDKEEAPRGKKQEDSEDFPF